MKKVVQTTHTLQAPHHKVWAAISQATGVNDWFPMVKQAIEGLYAAGAQGLERIAQ